MTNTTSNPYHLSPQAWDLGYRDHQLITELHEMGCDDDGYEAREAERHRTSERLETMSQPELRAFIDGMHSHAGEYLW